MKTNFIIFSKNRTLQLKSLLLSLRHYTDIAEDHIYVLYVSDDPDISYQPLMESFGCHFVEETSFLKNVTDIVDQEGVDYTTFLVDDLIFRDTFSIQAVEDLLDKRTDIDAFCFRLGKNIDCPVNPDFEEIDLDIHAWDTSVKLGKYWNYFWDLSSSLYRKELILDYISKCRPEKESFPNPFEYHYYSCMPTTRASKLASLANTVRYPFKRKSQRIACFSKSKCLTQGVNLVAEINAERTEHFNPKDLHQKMLDGYIVDFHCLENLDLKSPQPGHTYFKLINQNEVKQ